MKSARTRKPWLALAAFALLLVCAGQARSIPLILDYTGFAWTNLNHELPSTFNAVGVIDGFTLPVNDPDEVYTYYLSDLTLTNVITYSPTRRTYVYTGGRFSVYQSLGDGDRPYQYGTYPTNGTVPSSFTDGMLWLGGSLSSLSTYYDDNLKLGSLSATGSFTQGAFVPELAGDNYFTFAGLTAREGNGIPGGYRFRMDGQVEAEVTPVPEPASLGLLGLGLVAGAFALRRRRSPDPRS